MDGPTNAPCTIFFHCRRTVARAAVCFGRVSPEGSGRGEGKANSLLIRIYSDRKWPERIVYDTNAPTIVPASIASTDVIVQAPEMIADASADPTGREAFAMLLIFR